ncbi:S-formylglutathione hydrolase [Candidatus Tokpelaia sp.]|uniref:S-formylglutathione hydrolase n=1 Tax=Candidatus Tokpelaia sp. TaxID=2233777 RepID=UPI001238549F|nr:S-formylglutathione hydrolase [Candidatus Tokpelaia sp.]KAA6406017.1 S-formylglutathione hydrolase [Candidatus Tokpelaia sp.]
MRLVEQHGCFGGRLHIYEHDSAVLGCVMRFSAFLPPQAQKGKVPVVTFLAGLTCTYENFTIKAGAYGAAARSGLALIALDTSPRGAQIADDAAYDLGQGAGFYLNAVQQPWAQHYQMESYIAAELPALIGRHLPIIAEKQGIMGHSMGGHGALTLYLKYPQLYRSASAFAPIVAPAQTPWGQKAFTAYLGENKAAWAQHDACALMAAAAKAGGRADYAEILIDQGEADPFLAKELRPELFAAACRSAGQKLRLRMQPGYDHSYYFIQSFIADHIAHHAALLR